MTTALWRPTPLPRYSEAGRIAFDLEELWAHVREWAVANGHTVVPTYGIDGVAPT